MAHELDMQTSYYGRKVRGEIQWTVRDLVLMCRLGIPAWALLSQFGTKGETC